MYLSYFYTCSMLCWRRQWHPTPVLLPGKSMVGGAWWAADHGVAKSWTRLRDFTFTFLFHALEKEMAAHSSVLAWRVPGTGSLAGCRLWGRTESARLRRRSSSSSMLCTFLVLGFQITVCLGHVFIECFFSLSVPVWCSCVQ